MDEHVKDRLAGIESQLKQFGEQMESLGRDLNRPIDAVRDGYFEASLTNAGAIIEAMLRDIWKREGIKGEADKKTIEQLFSVVKERAGMDRLVQDYIRDIQLVRNRAAHGEETVVEDCLEALRKLSVILEWYFRTYVISLGPAEPEKAAVPEPESVMPEAAPTESERGRRGPGVAVLVVAAVLIVAALAMFFRARVAQRDPLDPATWQISAQEVADFDAINNAVHTYQKTKLGGRMYRDYDAALGLINGLIARGVDDPMLYLYRGRCLFDKHDYNEAEAAFVTAEDDPFRIWHVKTLLRTNRLQEAKTEFRAFKTSARVGDFSDEIAEVEEALAKLGGGLPFDVWLRIAELEDEGVSGEAAVMSLGRLAEDTASAELEVMLAGALYRSEPDRAMAHVRRALELEPGHRKALDLLVTYWYDKGEHGKMITFLREIVELHGADVDTAYNLACAYALTGDADAAINWLTTAVELGFKDFSHLRRDADLESIRKDKRYEELLYRYDR